MSTVDLPIAVARDSAGGFAPRLRGYRQARRLSQLELAAEAELAQRHLSFLEAGRARLSRAMVLQPAQALHLPLRERNRLRVAAGFAPLNSQRGSMRGTRRGCDRRWNTCCSITSRIRRW